MEKASIKSFLFCRAKLGFIILFCGFFRGSILILKKKQRTVIVDQFNFVKFGSKGW